MAEALTGDVVVSIITRRGGKSSESWVRKDLTPRLWSYFPHEIHLIHRKLTSISLIFMPLDCYTDI
jgi:hypothetical protein